MKKDPFCLCLHEAVLHLCQHQAFTGALCKRISLKLNGPDTVCCNRSKIKNICKHVHQHSSKWWKEECVEATSAKRCALRTFHANVSEENKEALRVATHTCQSVVDSARREHWQHFCLEKIKDPEDAPRLWKGVNALRRRARQPEKPLLMRDQYTRGVQEKADALAETFAPPC